MKNVRYIFPLIFLSLFACEKVIDVDLNEANPEVVIEGNVAKLPRYAQVKLSKTGSYFGESSNEKISGAKVVVEDDFGGRYIFDEVDDGLYKSFTIRPEEGISYKLTVEVDGESYESVSMLNPVVGIDSLEYYYDDGFAFLDAGYIVKAIFEDPEGIENFYRIKIFEIDSVENEYEDIILFDDRFIDGQKVEVSLRGYIFDIGDEVAIQLISLDKGVYQYYKTFQELLNVNPGSAAPANPTSNISNKALGYFSAWSSDIKTIVIENN